MDEHGGVDSQEAAAFSATPKSENNESVSDSLAEGLELDPRVEDIKNGLVAQWEQTNGSKYEDNSSLLRNDFLDFYYGTPSSPGIELRAREEFVARFPEDAKTYETNEMTRIYPKLDTDPAFRKVEQLIAIATNLTFKEAIDGKLGEIAKTDARNHYRGQWERYYQNEQMHQLVQFVRDYPEKAAAYSQNSELIKWAVGVKQNIDERNG